MVENCSAVYYFLIIRAQTHSGNIYWYDPGLSMPDTLFIFQKKATPGANGSEHDSGTSACESAHVALPDEIGHTPLRDDDVQRASLYIINIIIQTYPIVDHRKDADHFFSERCLNLSSNSAMRV